MHFIRNTKRNIYVHTKPFFNKNVMSNIHNVFYSHEKAEAVGFMKRWELEMKWEWPQMQGLHHFTAQ